MKSKIRQIESRNVLGMIPGSDPKLRDEYRDVSARIGTTWESHFR